MYTSWTYRKKRREKVLRKMAVMRAAKERKRIAESVTATECGRILFDGPMFGGPHFLRCLSDSDERVVRLEIDGNLYKPKSYRGVLRLLARRIVK